MSDQPAIIQLTVISDGEGAPLAEDDIRMGLTEISINNSHWSSLGDPLLAILIPDGEELIIRRRGRIFTIHRGRQP